MAKDIWDEMKKMQRRMNRWIRGFDSNPWESEEEDLSGYRRAWIDTRDLEDEYLIAVELPGVEKKDIELDLEDGFLKIKVEKRRENKDEEEDIYKYEQSYVGFYRRISLPEDADLDNVDAEYKNGVLKVRIKKLKGKLKKGKRIDVR